MLAAIEAVSGGEVPGAEGGWPDFGLAEYGRRYARLQTLMERSQIDAVVLSQPANVRYFTGFRTWFWALPPVITIVAILPRDPGHATLIGADTERGGLEATTWLPAPVTYGSDDDPFDVIGKALADRGLLGATLGLELGRSSRPHMSPPDFDRLRALAPDARWVDASTELSAVRALKSDAELARLRASVGAAQAGFQAAYDALKPGISEIELARAVAVAMLEAGATPAVDPSIVIVMAGSDRYRQPLQPSTRRRIGQAELVSLDGGCVVDGYHSDFARAAVIGDLPQPGGELLATVERSLDAAASAVTPGAPLSRAYAAARDILAGAGVADAMVNPHSIGHSIGLEHWEVPGIGPASDVCARPGMVLCLEPQIAGAHGDTDWRSGLFMLEDQIVVTDHGSEVLTNVIPRRLFSKR